MSTVTGEVKTLKDIMQRFKRRTMLVQEERSLPLPPEVVYSPVSTHITIIWLTCTLLVILFVVALLFYFVYKK